MKKKLLIFIITYKAKFRVKKVFLKIPFKQLKNIDTHVLISDDKSQDETIDIIKKIKGKKLTKKFNNINLGYGGHVKKCLNFAILNKFDYAVMLHGDGQYHPKYIPEMVKKISSSNDIFAVTGSRMFIKRSNALKGKMPIYKFVGNIFLTELTNLITGSEFTDCHSGFWIYKMDVFKKIKLKKITNGFSFDQQLRFEYLKKKIKIKEIPIKTIYGSERSSTQIVYATRYFIALFPYLYFRVLKIFK